MGQKFYEKIDRTN